MQQTSNQTVHHLQNTVHGFPVNIPSRAKHLLGDAIKWLRQGDQIALLTLVNIEGSAPYPPGSQMLVNQRGEYLGQITGGCAEVALADQAVAAIGQQANTVERYGLNSPYFDIQLPCGSGIDVHFEVAAKLADYEELHAKLLRRESAEQQLKNRLGVFKRVYAPAERLLVFGQGPILASLAQLARFSGFEVIAVAQDANSVARLNEMGVSAVELSTNKQDYQQICDKHTAVVSLFHEHEFETDILRQVLATEAFYIGALGSRRTHEQRLESLQSLGLSGADLDKIHGPVGLDIGANTPEQIAVSVIAQLIEKLPRADALLNVG
ncbi:MAG: XdhC family protein [Pseudomonadota bacterium]